MVAPPKPVTVTPGVEERQRAARIAQLLDRADTAFAASRLTKPDEDNAYLYYMQVLSLDADNEAALEGLAAMVDQYLAWSINHIEAGNLRQAQSFLLTAQSIDPNHPSIPAVENSLDARRRASLVEFTINLPRTGEPPPETQAQLARIAAQIERENATVVIFAPTDAQGRYLYQRLNEATTNRIRARFELSDRIRVRLIIPSPAT